MATLPPGPRLPQTAQWLAYGLFPYAWFTRTAARHDGPWTMRMMGDTFVILSDPAHVKAAFTGSPDDLRSGEANKPLRSLIGERNVLLLDGSEHLARRRLVLPPFHGDHLQAYEAVVRDVARRELEGWRAGEPLAVLPRMRAITFEVILRAVFGVDDRPQLERLERTLQVLLDWLTGIRQGIVFGLLGPERMERQPRFRRQRAAVDAEVLAHLRARRADPRIDEREDVLSMLLRARDADGRPLDDVEVRDELVTLLVAGHETTSALLTWALHDLARRPELVARLAAGEPGFAEAVVRETLRLHPPIPLVVRRLQRPLHIAGLDLPAGATLAPCAVLTHRRPDLYTDPERFDPDRFAGGEAPPTYGWLPFGGGVRRCIGAAFATMEARIVLEELAARFTLAPERAKPERVGRRGIVIVPARGGRVTVRRRVPAPRAEHEPARDDRATAAAGGSRSPRDP